MSHTHSLVVEKPEQTFVFVFDIATDTKEMIGALPELVNRDDVDFNWHDAALVAHALGRLQIDHLCKPETTDEP